MGVYQPLLWGLNVLLFCGSTAMLYLGSVLVNFYLLPSLWLFSENFATVPHLIIAIGVMLFFFSIFGFVAATSKNRILLAVYAGLMGVVFLLQLASIFTSMEFRNELDIERQEHGLVLGALQPMDDGRKCFRLIGDVLVERTVGEVSSERHSTAEQAGGGHGRAPTAPTALFWLGSAFPLCAARLLAQRG